MKPSPPPFSSQAHRMARSHDEVFFSLMAGEKAVVRLLGPRRTGKTDLVSFFARTERCPILTLSITPLPADVVSPSPVIAAMLKAEIRTLAHTSPKLHATYSAMREKEQRPRRKTTFAAEVNAGSVVKGSAQSETATPDIPVIVTDADVEIAEILRRLELAAMRTRQRPVVFFDEVQEVLLRSADAGKAAIWAIRNEVQHHTACRYVFAGSNQRLFAMLETGRAAPLLNLGTSLEIQPLTLPETDAWAKPLFEKGKRHLRSLSASTELLCGKIGEVVEVCNWLWAHSKPGDILDEAIQREGVVAVARRQPIESAVTALTAPQTKVLRWVLQHPGASPFGHGALAETGLNPGTVSSALKALVELELIESFGTTSYSCTTPLRTLAAFAPEVWLTRKTSSGPG